MTPHQRGTCMHCGTPILCSTLFELTVIPPYRRPVHVWVHMVDGHERCQNRDTYAEPTP